MYYHREKWYQSRDTHLPGFCIIFHVLNKKLYYIIVSQNVKCFFRVIMLNTRVQSLFISHKLYFPSFPSVDLSLSLFIYLCFPFSIYLQTLFIFFAFSLCCVFSCNFFTYIFVLDVLCL